MLTKRRSSALRVRSLCKHSQFILLENIRKETPTSFTHKDRSSLLATGTLNQTRTHLQVGECLCYLYVLLENIRPQKLSRCLPSKKKENVSHSFTCYHRSIRHDTDEHMKQSSVCVVCAWL